MHYALTKFGVAKQNEVQEILFRKYFSEGANLGEVPQLLDAAAEAGLDRAAVEAYLTSNEDLETVRRAVQSTRGVGGVPHFIFEATGDELSGGQDVAVFQEALTAAAGKK